MIFINNVLQVDTYRLTESAFRLDLTRSRWRPWRHSIQKSAFTCCVNMKRLPCAYCSARQYCSCTMVYIYSRSWHHYGQLAGNNSVLLLVFLLMSFAFFAFYVGGRWTNRHQTSPRVWCWSRFVRIGQKYIRNARRQCNSGKALWTTAYDH